MNDPLLPDDRFNQELEANVRPVDWQNPVATSPYQLLVIGAGTAGLVAAAGAAGLGARVAIVERALMGGDCLNFGCVPSKAIIRAGRAVAAVRDAERFGVHCAEGPQVDFAAVMERMRRLRAGISHHDSAKRFSELGVDVYQGSATFLRDGVVHINGPGGCETDVVYKKAVIATGARASAPPISGLERVNYLTNETLFSLTELPARLGVIGAGPIGAEMAQTFARLGSKVTLYEMADRILAKEDADAVSLVQKQFDADGVQTLTGIKDLSVSKEGSTIRITGTRKAEPIEVVVDQLLVAVGRAPNTNGLGLESVGVAYDKNGVTVNDFLQTTNPRIFAAGDICSKFKFTHAADFMARIVIQNALFAVGPFGRRRASKLLIPWTTYTSPEVAHVGIYESEAASAGIAIDTYTQDFSGVDRAILDGSEGFVRVHVKKGTDKILGATVVGENAGDLISEITMAMTHRLGLSKIGSTIHSYPTTADSIRKLGDQYNRKRLTGLSKWILSRLLRWNA